jgi:hypothetical protein
MTFTKLFLSSKEREPSSSSTSDFRLKLPRPILAGERYELIYAQIPQTVYNLDSNNNSFVLNDGSPNALAIPPGFYTANTIVTELQTQLNAVSALTFTVAFSETSQKITITASGPFTVNMNGVGSPLGFITTTGSATSHTGGTILNLETTDSLFIHVNEIRQIDYIQGGSTFAIPSNVNQLQVIDYNERSGFRQTITFNNPCSVLTIRLTDSENRVVDLNGSQWYLILERSG